MNDGDRRDASKWIGSIITGIGVAITAGWIGIVKTQPDTSHRDIVDLWLIVGMLVAVVGLVLLGSAYWRAGGEGVRVVHAAWGVPHHGFVDVTATVRAHVRNGTLNVHASNDELVGGPHNDPVVGKQKYLVVQWAYKGKGKPQAAWAEDDTAVLPLGPNYVSLEEMATPMITFADFKVAAAARPRKPSGKKA